MILNSYYSNRLIIIRCISSSLLWLVFFAKDFKTERKDMERKDKAHDLKLRKKLTFINNKRLFLTFCPPFPYFKKYVKRP